MLHLRQNTGPDAADLCFSGACLLPLHCLQPFAMTYAKRPVHQCKYTDCVDVCPVDCFYEGETCSSSTPMSASIAACEPECPADAIKPDSDIADKWIQAER